MKKTKQRTRAKRLVYALVAVIIVGGVSALAYESSRPAVNVSQYDPTLPAVVSNGYVLGSPTAPVEVKEFADFECPSCGQFSAVIEPDIRTEFINTGKVRWRYIDFPLPMHKNTWNASRAAACADEQGKFWQMHDAIFQSQDRWNGETTSNPDKVFKSLAQQIGLNTSQFNQCVDTRATQAKIQAHLKLGEAAHVDATPTFVIAGQTYAGLQTYDQLKAILDKAIAAAPADTSVKPMGDTALSRAPHRAASPTR